MSVIANEKKRANELQQENDARILKELEAVETYLALAIKEYNKKKTKAHANAVKYYEDQRDNILRRLQGEGKRKSRRRKVINIDTKTMKKKEASLPTVSAEERRRRSNINGYPRVKNEAKLDYATSKALNRLYNLDNLRFEEEKLEDEIKELEQEMQLLRMKLDNANTRLSRVKEILQKKIAKRNNIIF